jgi:hypothetical protein
MATPLPFEEGGYETQLQHLGIPHDALLEAIGASNTERRLCSVHSTRTAFGFYAYNGLVVGMTSQLRHHGYTRIDLNGVLPLWVNDERRIKLGVTSGTAMTGVRVPKYQPRSRYPKGELFRQMVKRNNEAQLTPLFDISMETDVEAEPVAEYRLWLELVYFDKAESEVRYEISHPVEVNARGFITAWSPRIIMPPYSIAELDRGDDDPNEGFGDVDFPVEPR